MKIIINKIALFFVCLIIQFSQSGFVSAQETLVVGQVLNIADKSPIENVNVYFKNTNIGVKTSDEGYFMVRTTGNETTVVFSCVGYVRKEIKVKLGQSVGMQVEMREENTMLQEVFVVPGANPAMELMRKVRLMKSQNDLSSKADFSSQRTEQNLVLLGKLNQRSVNKRIYEQLTKGALSSNDSLLTIPLYMDESTYALSSSGKKMISNNKFSSPVKAEQLILGLVGEISNNFNFYDNNVTLFGKSLVSPLANVGNAYYQYFLADSLNAATGKQYQVNFRTKNAKNLAFNGKMMIDSSSLALVSMEAVLPQQANLNFIHNFVITQKYKSSGQQKWSFDKEMLALNLTYEMLSDSLHPKPAVFVKRSVVNTGLDSMMIANSNFAASNYDATTLDEKMGDLNETPILKAAKWLADVLITGYIPVGKLDFGKIQNVVRITDLEGFRLTVPLRTNQLLWKNISVGGHLGYGFKNNQLKYAAFSQFKIPGAHRNVLSVSYTDDYRRIDYDYNDFMMRENPLVSGDEDIVGTLFALRLARNLSERKEFETSFSKEWNSDIESNVFVRSNQYLSAAIIPFALNGTTIDHISHQSVTLSTRFSFGERTYDDHIQRIYIANYKPVIYAILEGGQYQAGTKSGNYAKVTGLLKQFVKFDIGQWNYALEGGCVFGSVPYTLLETPAGSETAGYKRYQFTMLNYMEYTADRYVTMHNELLLNGIVLNQIPLIKHLNLREMFSFKMFYGTMNNAHSNVLDFPVSIQSMTTPYMELGAGFSNILRLFTLQAVWRLTDLNHPGVSPFGLRASVRVSF